MTTSAPVGGTLRFGAIGCGDIARRRTLPAMLQTPGVELRCVGSRDKEKAEVYARLFDCAAVTGYEALLERPDVDAVYISVPAMLHAEWVARSLRAGKHVLVEKPLTNSHAMATRLFELSAEHGLVLRENFMFLHHSQHARVGELLTTGAIGQLRSFASAFTIPPRAPGDIRYRGDVGGGALLDIGVYPVRAALHLLGPHLEVLGAVLRKERRREVVLSGSILLATPEGVGAQLSFGMEQSYRSSYDLYGSTGVLSVDRAFTPPDTHQPVVRLALRDQCEEIVLLPDPQFVNTIAAFRRGVLEGTGVQQSTDSSLRQALLLEQIMRCAEVKPV